MMLLVCYVVVILTQIGDYVSTVFALRKAGVVEKNPVVRMIGLLPAKILATLVMCAAVTLVYPETPALALGGIGLFTILYAAVIWHNFTI